MTDTYRAMTNHPITPPPELVEQWSYELADLSDHFVLARAARWGADQELNACCEWLGDIAYRQSLPLNGSHLRADRRPKPLSLKGQAMRVLFENGMNLDGRMELDSTDIETILRALEALPND